MRKGDLLEWSVLAGPLDTIQPRIFDLRVIDLRVWAIANLSAPYWRCFVPLAEGGEVLWNDQAAPLTPGEVVLIPPYTAAASHLLSPFQKIYCHFELPISDVESKPGVYSTTLPDFFSKRVKIEAQKKDLLKLSMLMTTLIGLSVYEKTDDIFTPGVTYSTTINQVIKMMKSSYQQPLSNGELADQVDMHPNSLARLFTKETGMSPQRFGMKLRLDEAARLLSTTNQTIEDIAQICGFWDRNHFTKVFKEEWKCPPAQFRRNNNP